MTTPAKLFRKPQPIPEAKVSADQLPRLAKGLLRYALKKLHAAQDREDRNSALVGLLRATARIGERDLILAGAVINQLAVEGVSTMAVWLVVDAHREDGLIDQLRRALLERFDDDSGYERVCNARGRKVWTRKTA